MTVILTVEEEARFPILHGGDEGILLVADGCCGLHLIGYFYL